VNLPAIIAKYRDQV